MGSPLGPVLANIFLGYCESLIPDERWPDVYCRFMDDTFSVFSDRDDAFECLQCLNGLHPALRFTMEEEQDNSLPFMDVLVLREGGGFSMTVYRKPTFTGLYTRWDSYCSTGQKIALIRSLTHRALKICSSNYLDEEISKLKMFHNNGDPGPIVGRVIKRTLESSKQVMESERPKVTAAYIRLPWLGAASLSLKNRIFKVTNDAIPLCEPVCVFTSKKMLSTSKKDVLPAEDVSNVVYLFNCVCGHSYVGRTTQRLGDRVRQHVPVETARLVTEQESPKKRKCGRPRKNGGLQGGVIQCDFSVENEGATPTSQVSGPRRSKRLREKMADKSDGAQQRKEDEEIKPGVMAMRCNATGGDSAITKHLKSSVACLKGVCADVMGHFKVITRARNKVHLSILEALLIGRLQPKLCAQKEHVRNLQLF